MACSEQDAALTAKYIAETEKLRAELKVLKNPWKNPSAITAGLTVLLVAFAALLSWNKSALEVEQLSQEVIRLKNVNQASAAEAQLAVQRARERSAPVENEAAQQALLATIRSEGSELQVDLDIQRKAPGWARKQVSELISVGLIDRAERVADEYAWYSREPYFTGMELELVRRVIEAIK